MPVDNMNTNHTTAIIEFPRNSTLSPLHSDYTTGFNISSAITNWAPDYQSADNNSTSDVDTPPLDAHAFIWAYISPVILVLGTLGNLLTLIVMRRPRLRNTTTSVYLSLMSVSDTAALISRIAPESFKALHLFSFSDFNRWTCRFEKFTFYTSSDVAIWILVAFTFDRWGVCLTKYTVRPVSQCTRYIYHEHLW